MAISAYQEEDPYKQTGTEAAIKESATKRLRWATHRHTPASSRRKRQSIMDRLHKRSPSDKTTYSDGTDAHGDATEHGEGADAAIEVGDRRTIYFNMSLPTSARDEEGHPLAQYPRNKIRTAKYTPLSFIPKNLWYQFHNIANIYFLFIIILQVLFTLGDLHSLADQLFLVLFHLRGY